MIGCIVEDRYRIESELGTGAMGRVYAARHIKVGRRVAIKVMHDDLAKNPAIVERFEREGMIAARLRHPNLVAVLDVGTAPDGRPLIILELAPGEPLSEIALMSMAAPRVVSLVSQLLHGLDHAHRAGLIHRDLKPDNILVETTTDGTEIPRVVDFGIAITAQPDTTIAGRRLTEANTVIGTPFYMSPEQARAKDVDQRSDLFSLGVIMYELLAGMPPFPGTSLEVALANVTREAPSIAERAGIEVDPVLEAFVRKLMARNVDQRFQSARQALDVLALIETDRIAAARVLSGGPMPASPPVIREAPPLLRAIVRPNSDQMTTIDQPVVTDQEPSAYDHDYDANQPSPGHADAADDEPSTVHNAYAPSTVLDKAAYASAAVRGDDADDDASAVRYNDAADDDFSDLDFSPRTIMRRRKRFAFGFATAAMALLAAAGFAMRAPEVVDAPTVDVSADVAPNIQPELPVRVSQGVDVSSDVASSDVHPELTVRDRQETHALSGFANAPALAHPTFLAVPARPAHTVLAALHVAQPAMQVAQPAMAVVQPMPAVFAPAADPIVEAQIEAKTISNAAAEVAAKYSAVAKALKHRPSTAETDALWARFRLIRFYDAIQTEQSRRETLVALSSIEDAIR